MIRSGIPPGNILQLMYLKERLNSENNQGKTFVEIGSGNGLISNLLLEMGFSGVGFDLNEGACQNNQALNKRHIDKGDYSIQNADFLSSNNSEADVVISSMVIEHMEQDDLDLVVQKAKSILKKGGKIITLVPASMQYWGIEDEIAGHIKRYEKSDVLGLEKQYDLELNHVAGLTYPISNIFFQLSNLLIQKNEQSVLSMDQKEKTIYTGNRQVKYKTTFPSVFKLILNPVVLYPFHILQKMNRNNPKSMVLYFEMSKN